MPGDNEEYKPPDPAMRMVGSRVPETPDSSPVVASDFHRLPIISYELAIFESLKEKISEWAKPNLIKDPTTLSLSPRDEYFESYQPCLREMPHPDYTKPRFFDPPSAYDFPFQQPAPHYVVSDPPETPKVDTEAIVKIIYYRPEDKRLLDDVCDFVVIDPADLE